jgi:hypothetical protein
MKHSRQELRVSEPHENLLYKRRGWAEKAISPRDYLKGIWNPKGVF